MTETDYPDIAPEDTGDGKPISATKFKDRKSLSKIRREISDEELSSPAVQRLLIDEIERLEKENERLAGFQNRYHEADKNAAVLSEKLRTHIAQDVIFGLCLTVGAILIGLSKSLWAPDKPDGQISLLVGSVLIVGGVISKVIKRWR